MDAALTCTFFILIICTHTVITAETHHKRSPQGFQGVRGKRSAEELNAQKQSNNLAVQAPTTEHSLINNEVRQLDLTPISLVKRAPIGFMGMRGKKDNQYYEYDDSDLQDQKYLVKRAPSGFMGMRGKRQFDEDDMWDAIKRAPSGFLGMRGKKETIDPEYYNAIPFDVDFFQNLQNERDLLNDFQRLTDEVPEYSYRQDEKRAPSAGFIGMRGKKFITDDELGYDGKRAPSSGFFGMRGKKWIDDDLEDISMSEEKRVPMGFQGMRGKKDSSDIMSDEKRAPAPGFFGMRGKKGPIGAGFFGSRGKKGPFEFRGKFVGVRGKKIPPGSLRKLAFDLGGVDLTDLQTASLVDDFDSVKRGPMGFQGMRGKKWSNTQSDK